MDEIELRVRAGTDRLLQARTGIVATVVVLGIVAGNVSDLLLGRLFEHPYRLGLNVAGFIAMATAIFLSRRPHPILAPRALALGTTLAFCAFMLAMSIDAGPDAATVVVVAYTVMNLGAATLLPWGVWNQLVLVLVVLASIHASYVLLGRPLFLDVYVYIATLAGLGLSLFVAYSLEQNRLLLARQKEKAEALASDLDAYAHAVAHDLKNPIHLIAGYAKLLEEELDDRLDGEGREYLSRTISGCSKMTQIIDSLLLLARVRKRRDVPTEPLDMGSVVGEACARVSHMIQESGAQVVEPPQWPHARGHAQWVEEVWANYLSNAIKYGGSPPILELGAESNGNGQVHFWVRDNGRGLNENEVGLVFEEFTRLDEAGAEGHGLGLPIVKRIVERLGGEVSVTSAPGTGSTFGFTLPA